MRKFIVALVVAVLAAPAFAGERGLPPVIRDAVAELNKICRPADDSCLIPADHIVPVSGAKDIVREFRERGEEISLEDAKTMERTLTAFVRDENGRAVLPVFVNTSLTNPEYRRFVMPHLDRSDLQPSEATLLMASVVYHEYRHASGSSELQSLDAQVRFLAYHVEQRKLTSSAARGFVVGKMKQLQDELHRARAVASR